MVLRLDDAFLHCRLLAVMDNKNTRFPVAVAVTNRCGLISLQCIRSASDPC